MITADNIILTTLKEPVREIRGRVEILEGSALLDICKCADALKEMTIERVGDTSKFFGYGIVQKLNVHLIDKERQRNITTANTLDVAFGVVSDYVHPFPQFKVTEVHRDENTNELSITAYDSLYEAGQHTIEEIPMSSYTLYEMANACAALLGVAFRTENIEDNVFNLVYPSGANFSGKETIREVLDAIAEATQTIYYINSEGLLIFKRLDLADNALYTIDRDNYFTAEVGDNRRLSAITHITELGDNLTATAAFTGTTQYIRENPFYTLRDDLGTLLDNALVNVSGMSISQFNTNWRGNFLIELGDRIGIEDKTGTIKYSYLLDDTIHYDGTLSQKTQWKYTANDAAADSNSTTIGDTIKNTYARVDKANKEIALVASTAEDNKNNIASLNLNTESISASVESVRAATEEAFETVNSNIGNLINSVAAQITAEDVTLSINTALENGVSKVETETGFTFNSDGLRVSKSESEISTLISEDGMNITKNNDVVLTANNTGVEARNLHATTYLIIGNRSRFEDYGYNRTGCFWIGGE